MNNLTFMLLLLLLLPLNLGLHPNPGLDPRQIFLEPAEAPDPHAVMVEPANLEPPELLAPAHNYLSFDGMPTFRCGTSQGATSYQFCISKQSYNGPCETNKSSLSYISSLNSTEYRPWAPLLFRGVIAKWHVHALETGPVLLIASGPATPDRALRLVLPSAELTLPNNNAQVGNRPEFRWQSVLGATRYKIVVTGGPKRQKKEYVLSSKHPSFDSRSFIPPASDPIPFSGTVTWSVNAYNAIVPYYSKPVFSPGSGPYRPVPCQIRKMRLPTRGGKTPLKQK